MKKYELIITDGSKNIMEVVYGNRVEEAMHNLSEFYRVMRGMEIWLVHFREMKGV